MSKSDLQAEQQVAQLDDGLRALAREREDLLHELEEAREVEREHREIHNVLLQRADEALQADQSFSLTTPG